jgi:anti-sigma regulatory factor (Ser/Thr protein kinase)
MERVMTRRSETIEIIDDVAAIATVVRFIERAGPALGLDRDAAARLCVILEELVTNTLGHGHDDRNRHRIAIRLERDGQDLSLTYEDDGRPFDPLSIAEPDFDTPVERWPIGRLGLHLVKRLVDRAAYERLGDKNRLTLRKCLVDKTRQGV